MKKPLKIALYALLALVLAALAYVIYVFAAYYRVEDYQTLDVVRTTCEFPVPMGDAAETDVTYRITSANVGFGAYIGFNRNFKTKLGYKCSHYNTIQ